MSQYELVAGGVVETCAQPLVTLKIVKPSSVLRQIKLSLDFIGCFLLRVLAPLLPQLVGVPRRPEAFEQRQQGRQKFHSPLLFSAKSTATRPATPAMAAAAAL